MINIIGLGPGSKDYILPIAIKKIKSADIVIGATRNLESIKEYHSNFLDLSIGFSKIAEYLKTSKENIAVVVSGDSGFYSMLDFVKRTVGTKPMEVIPGISSLQYMYSKLNMGYENSKWVSLHGRDCNLENYIKLNRELGILTDKEHNNRYIAKKIKNLNLNNVKIYVGERLSYPDEKISCLNILEAEEYIAEDLSVVVLTYE